VRPDLKFAIAPFGFCPGDGSQELSFEINDEGLPYGVSIKLYPNLDTHLEEPCTQGFIENFHSNQNMRQLSVF
jgi:hypothetical protein